MVIVRDKEKDDNQSPPGMDNVYSVTVYFLLEVVGEIDLKKDKIKGSRSECMQHSKQHRVTFMA